MSDLDAERDAFARDAEADAQDAELHEREAHEGFCLCGARIRGLTIRVCEVGHIQSEQGRGR